MPICLTICLTKRLTKIENMGLSVIATIRTDRRKVGGYYSIKIRVIFKRKVVLTENTGRNIKLDQWDNNRREVINHPQAKLYNLAIKNRINEIEQGVFKAEMSGQIIDVELIKMVVRGKDENRDFYKFCEEFIPVKYPHPTQHQTRRSYLGELSKMKQFKPSLSFYQITPSFIMEYEFWLINVKGNHSNTVWKAYKFLSVMLKAAVEKYNYIGVNPMKQIARKKYVNGTRQFLELDEMRKLVEYRFKVSGIPYAVLTYFLFMCRTGLRFKDAMKFNLKDHVQGNCIYMKTDKEGVIVNLEITPAIRELLPLPELKLNNKDFNKYIQAIAGSLQINKHLTAHIARHTFGATLALLDIPIALSQKLLGHADKRSTEIYYHIRNTQLKEAMEKMSRLYLDQTDIDRIT